MDFFIPFIAGALVGISLFFIVLVGPVTTPNHVWQNAAIERGYALYCPTDGQFAWKDECEK